LQTPFFPGLERDAIESVQIVADEEVGVESRAGTTTTAGRCGTWCRTTCSRFCPSLPWRPRPIPRRAAARGAAGGAACHPRPKAGGGSADSGPGPV
jgi:hypothetical protein